MNEISPSWFGADAVLDHVGLAVKSIRAVLDAVEPVTDAVQKVRVAFFDLHGVRIELIEPLSADSPVTKTLQRGPGVYHVCYRVPDLDGAITEAGKRGFHLIGQPTPAPAFNGRPIAWLYHGELGLFELVQA
ncbi:MAG: VOC family protein [Limisphaerales bacterium]